MDDALDVWGVHGMGGLTGAILTGTLASPHVWDTGDGIGAWTGTAEGMEQQAISIIGAAISIGYAFGVTIVILKVMDAVWRAESESLQKKRRLVSIWHSMAKEHT